MSHFYHIFCRGLFARLLCGTMCTMDEDKLAREILLRLEQMSSIRDKFIPRWKDAQRFVAPVVYNWSNLDAVPEVPKRYSSEPCDYLNTLVSGLAGYSISPNLNWFKLSLEDTALLSRYGVKDWLEQAEEILAAEFNRSNLYREVIPLLQDGAVIGHGVMLCTEDSATGKLRYATIRPNEIYLDCNDQGDVDTVYRRYVMTTHNAVLFFGEDKVPDRIREDNKDMDKWGNLNEFVLAVYPDTDSASRSWLAVHIDVNGHKVVRHDSYDDNPFAVFLWDRIPGLPYSNSPAVNALPDIKALNIIKETSLKICQTSAEPPLRVSDTLRNINLVPRGYTYVSSPDEVIEPIRTGENYPITLQILEDVKQDIKQWFNVDFFLTLQQKQGKMTATEVMELQGEKSAVLSSLVVSLNDTLRKIISRSFDILSKSGRIPPAPESIAGTGAPMKVDFIGPLAYSQKKYHTMGGIAQALQLAAPIMQIFPNAGDWIDADELMKRAMEGQGMPQAVIREDDDVKAIRQQRAQQQAQQQAAAMAQQQGQELMRNADKLGHKAEPGSVMAELNRQLTGGMDGQAAG